MWGNPFLVKDWGRSLAVLLYQETVSGGWNPRILAHCNDQKYRMAYGLREKWLARLRSLNYGHPVESIRSELKGKDLACWCAPELCHGDVLLAVANEVTAYH
jgi:hypothetical protein